MGELLPWAAGPAAPRRQRVAAGDVLRPSRRVVTAAGLVASGQCGR
ncbi:hypothetical protein [Micromonospora sonneratiae]|uniref:Uncharacterized protein n=1 Tax=Micromonospora sonneratiae TaxID=1184706 RepID=A0ABW3YFW2_9ACTN